MAKNKEQKVLPQNTYEVLTAAGFHPSLPLQSRKILTTAENGRKYVLQVSGNPCSVLFNVDGYIIKNGQKCDKLILTDLSPANNNQSWMEIFVELKGKDVAHAIDQLRETLKNPIFKHPSNKKIKARIVAASFPAHKSNPIMEKAKIEFAKKPYYCELKGMKNGQTDCI